MHTRRGQLVGLRSATALLSAAFVLLAGCSSGSSGRSASTSTPGEPSSAQAAPPAQSSGGSPASAPASGSASAAPVSPALIDAAKKDGSVTWYTSITESFADDVAKAFQDEYGIKVSVIHLSAGPLGARFSSEEEAGKSPADMLTIADPVLMESATTKGWISPLNVTDTPNLANWPKDDVHSGTYMLIGTQPIGIGYNTSKLNQSQVATWQALASPALKGQWYLVDPTGIIEYITILQLLDTTYGDDFLKSLAANEPKLIKSSTSAAQQMGAGSGIASFPSTTSATASVKNQGGPVDISIPTPTTGVEQYGALVTKAPHPSAAKLLLNFLMSEKGQELFNAGTASSPLGPLPGTLPLPAGYQQPPVDAAVKNQQRLLALVGIHS
jgi:iron(III) transport system substrate-binding protein